MAPAEAPTALQASECREQAAGSQPSASQVSLDVGWRAPKCVFPAAKPALGRRRASARSSEAIHHATAPNAAPLPQPRSITNKYVQWPANGALKPQNSGTETNRRCTEPSTGSWNQQAYGGSSTRASGRHRKHPTKAGPTLEKQSHQWLQHDCFVYDAGATNASAACWPNG